VTRRSLHRGRVGDFGLEQVVLPNGAAVTLEVLRHPGAAAAIPLHDDGTVTLIRQYRHAGGGFMWEIPAGKLEPGEDPAACAARELAEEAGLEGVLERLMVLHTTPAFTDERIWIYAAHGLRPVAQALEGDEVLTVHRLPLREAEAMVRRGEITDGKTALAILLSADRTG
jgi:ADP-ribose pyrophosphatase